MKTALPQIRQSEDANSCNSSLGSPPRPSPFAAVQDGEGAFEASLRAERLADERAQAASEELPGPFVREAAHCCSSAADLLVFASQAVAEMTLQAQLASF